MKKRRIAAFILVVFLIMNSFFNCSFLKDSKKIMAEGMDLVRGKSVKVSGFNGDGENGEKAVDGDDSTKWCAVDDGMVKWLVVDLGEKTRFNTYVVKNAEYGGEFADYNTRDFMLQVSDDGKNWKTADCVKNNRSSIVERKIEEQTARYVRLYITWATQRSAAGGDAGYVRIYGFELYNNGYEPLKGWSEGYEGKATSVAVVAEEDQVEVNSEIKLSASVAPSSADQTVTYSTEDTNIIQLDENTGVVRGRSKGTAYVTATANDGGAAATIRIDVTGGDIVIEDMEQTLWYIEESGVYKNEILMYCSNDSEARDCWLKVSDGNEYEIQSIGTVEKGRSTVSAFIPECTEEKTYTISLYDNAKCTGKAINSSQITVKPVRKWSFYIAQNMHMDIGFTNPQEYLINTFYPSVYRQALQEIENNSNFKYPAEQSFLLYGAALKYPDAGFYDQIKNALENGNLSYPMSFASSYLSAMNQEVLSRSMYTSGRFLYELTGTKSSQVVNCTDVQGIPKGAIDTLVSAGTKYFVFRPNNDTTTWSYSRYPRLFYLTGNQKENKLLTWSSYHYGIDEFGFRNNTSSVAPNGVVSKDFIQSLTQTAIENYQTAEYPYDAILIDFTEGGDNGMFNKNVIYNINALNARKSQTGKNYVYPKFISSTETDFFEYITENFEEEIPEYSQGMEEYWVHGMGTFAYETGLAKKVNIKLPTAEKYASLSSFLFDSAYPKAKLDNAWDMMNLWYEHTYGSGPSGSKLDDIWVWKRSTAYAADEYAESILKDSVGEISQNIKTDSPAVSVYNSMSNTRDDLVTVSADGLPQYFDLIDRATGKNVTYQKEDGNIVFIASQVPGNGYKVFEVRERTTPPVFEESSITVGDNYIENKYFKVVFDETGSIASIIDKENDKELVDTKAEYGFNQFIYLNTSSNNSGKSTVLGEIAKVTKAKLTSSVGPVFGTMTASGAEGVERGADNLERTITLYSDIARIDIGNTVLKKEAPTPGALDEEGFFVFPLNMENFKIVHETVSGVLDSSKNSSNPNSKTSELLTGSCLDFFTVNRWIDVGNQKDYGVVLCPTDSYFVQYGERTTYAHNLQYKIEDPYIYSWVFNNKWWTNHQKTQPGPVTFNYSLYTRQGEDYISGKSDLYGAATAEPLQAEIIKEAQPDGTLDGVSDTFLDISEDNVTLLAMKQSESNGSGMILRFYEGRGISSDVSVDLSMFDVVSVNETNVIEDNILDLGHNVKFENGTLKFEIKGFETVTVRVILREEQPEEVKGISAVSDEKATYLKWEKNENVSYYEIYRSSEESFTAGPGTYLDAVEECCFYDEQVKQSTGNYYYKVIAVKNGTKGPEGKAVKTLSGNYATSVAPTVPTNLIADTTYTGRASLRWTYSTDDIAVDKYILYRDGKEYKEIDAAFCSTLDYMLPEDGIAEYYVKAVDVNGNISDASNTLKVSVNVDSTETIASNIAAYADITASSFFYQDAPDNKRVIYQPTNVADGIIGVLGSGEWCSNWETTPWLMMRFDRSYEIYTLNLYGRVSDSDRILKLLIEFSDGSSITLEEKDLNTSGALVPLNFEKKTVEWIKFSVLEGTGCPGFSEIEVLRKTDEENEALKDLALGKPVTASGYINDDESPEKAVDGNPNTKWCDTGNGLEKWLVVDLLEETIFDRYVLQNAESGGESKDYNTRDFRIEISSDGKKWTVADTVEENTEGVVDRTLKTPVEARYVRLYITRPTQKAEDSEDAGYARIYGFELYNMSHGTSDRQSSHVGYIIAGVCGFVIIAAAAATFLFFKYKKKAIIKK